MPASKDPKPQQNLHAEVGETVVGGVLREYSDPGGTEHTAANARAAIEEFLHGNRRALKAGDDVREESASEGVNTLRITYQQYLNDLPVFGAGVHAAANIERASVTRVTNTSDDKVGNAPAPAKSRPADEVEAAALGLFTGFDGAEVTESTLGYYRDSADARPTIPPEDYPTASVALLSSGDSPDGRLHLVRDVRIDTNGPFERFRVMVDAVHARVLFVELVSKYVAATGQVFLPDPVSESNSGTLSSTSNAATLNAFRHTVTMDVDPASGGQFRLQGPWIRCVDWDTPSLAVPVEATANFSYQTYPSNRHFLNVNAYHWLDTFARYLRGLSNPNLNATMTRVDVDAQGFNGADNSSWVPGPPNRIRFGEGGVPDAADFGVIVHEYLHGVFQFQGSNHGGSLSYEHSFCDAIAAIFRDRYNPAQNRRTETFPFDNNATNRWSTERTLDRTERFDDAGFSGYSFNLRNSMLGTVIWQSYLGVGGDSPHPAVRERAANVVIKTFLEMLLNVPDSSSNDIAHARSLAQGMIDADIALAGGLHRKVFQTAAINRGLWPAPAVDLWIGDSPTDTGAIPSPMPHWTSPDLWVRNLGPADGDNPDLGHQDPIVGQPNYLYVLVHNRGTAASSASGYAVEAFHCDPGTGMVYPTDFTSMGTLALGASIPAGGSVRVGPFLWTPSVVDHECLLAIVNGAEDPAVTTGAIGAVPHGDLVRFDNNVGQRNVHPVMAVPGGQPKSSMVIRGGLRRSRNSVTIDASGCPRDTVIDVRTLSRVIDAATLTGIERTQHGKVRSTVRLTSAEGAFSDFPLAAHDTVALEFTIDFSRKAKHLERYPIVITQEQDGVIAGRVTIEVVAVKELDDFVFGNPRSREMHTTSCPWWPKLGAGSKIPFVEIADGLARGYDGCAFCLPEHNHG